MQRMERGNQMTTKPEIQPMNKVTKTAPKKIFLQVSDDADDCGLEFPVPTADLTWCEDSVLACEVEYIRADLASHALEKEPSVPVSYWCIEWPDKLDMENGQASRRAHWAGINSDGCPTESIAYVEWVVDIQKAIKFQRKIDAEAVLRMTTGMPSKGIVTEHIDMDKPNPRRKEQK
jgi:hypothetical protein